MPVMSSGGICCKTELDASCKGAAEGSLGGLPLPGQLSPAVLPSLQAGAAAGWAPPRSGKADPGATMSGTGLRKRVLYSPPLRKQCFLLCFSPDLVK